MPLDLSFVVDDCVHHYSYFFFALQPSAAIGFVKRALWSASTSTTSARVVTIPSRSRGLVRDTQTDALIGILVGHDCFLAHRTHFRSP